MNPPNNLPPQTNSLDTETLKLFTQEHGLTDESKRQTRLKRIINFLEFEISLAETMKAQMLANYPCDDTEEPIDEEYTQEDFVQSCLETGLRELEGLLISEVELNKLAATRQLNFQNATS
jgi:hypothetical protein